MKKYTKQYINGEWREGTGERMLENVNPYNDEILYSYRSASQKDMDDAYQSAKEAYRTWKNISPRDRNNYINKLATVLEDLKDEVYDILTKECGSVDWKCGAEYYGSLDHIHVAAGFPYEMQGEIVRSVDDNRMNYIFKKPKGVIGVIAPWNFPFLLAMRSVVPAVAAGNTVVLKPSKETPASAFVIAEMFERAGFPRGVLNVISGYSDEVGDSFVTHPIPSLISFTGSTEVGRRIGKLTGESLKDVSLELGGNNPMLVLEDADLLQAARGAIGGSYSHAGQICMATNRIIVHEAVHDEFVKLLVEESKKVKIGNPEDKENFYGPLTNANQVKSVEESVRKTISEGATVALEGRTEGKIIYPWVLTNVTNDMVAAKCETFGPVCSVIKAKSEDEMVEIANATNYGLSSCVFTKDRYRGMQVASRIESGMSFVNDHTIGEEAHIVFGGEKDSGIGRFNAAYVLNKFTTEQRVGVQEVDKY